MLKPETVAKVVPPALSATLGNRSILSDHFFFIVQSAEVVVWGIRAKIFERTRLTASAGIAPTRMLAKICSGALKVFLMFAD